MATLVIKTNASQATDYLINDLGFPVPNSGGSVTFTATDEIGAAQNSDALRAALVDNAFGAGSSTLILNDGGGDIAQADALNFLDTLLLPAGNLDYGVVKTDENGQIATNLNWDGTATINNVTLGNDLDANGNEVTGLPSTPSGPTAAASAAYVDSIAVQVRPWKEVLISSDQLLNGAAGAILQGVPFFLANQPVSGDFLIIDDGTTARQYNAVAGGDVQFAIGASADDTMDNLAAAISGDGSGLWNAVVLTDLESINTGAGSSSAGRVILIYRRAQGVDSYDDRIYGTFATQTDAVYVNFNGELHYEKSTTSTLPTVDPAQKEFGIGRANASLQVNETHLMRSGDTIYTWDSDGELWNLTGTGAIDYGLVGDIQPLGSSLAAGVLNRVARADHVHTHGDRGGDGSASQHDADQVDVEGTYVVVSPGGATDAETAFSNIGSAFASGAKAGKWLHFAHDKKVPSSGVQYLQAGLVLTSVVAARMLRAGKLTGGSLQVDVIDAANAFKLSVKKNGTEVETVALATSTLGNQSTVFTTTYAAGDLISVSVERTAGAGASAFGNMRAVVEHVDD